MESAYGQSHVFSATSEQPRRSYAPKVRLSCEACHQRKVKCDKLDPCTNCTKIGAVCVPVERTRLPRGRTQRAGNQASRSELELKERVSKLERLLRDMCASQTTGASVDGSQGSLTPSRNDTTPPGTGGSSTIFLEARRDIPASLPEKTPRLESYMGGSFWAELIEQTDEPENPANHDSPPQEYVPGDALSYETVLVGLTGPKNQPSPSNPVAESLPDAKIRKRLVHIFLFQVDPVLKILHRPSLSAFLLQGKPYLDYEPGHPAPTALACAVYYAASCVLTEEQCQSLFAMSKESLTARYRREAETALVQADFIVSDELVVLQAYVLSLVAARLLDQSRRAWTMLSMALRIAQALLLYLPDPPFPVSPFEREMRRRVWNIIGYLDVQCSLDRATEPMMRASWLQSHPPANVNDSAFHFGTTEMIEDSPNGFTDMSLTLVLLKAQCAVRLLNFTDFREPGVKDMNVRLQIVADFHAQATSLFRHCQPETISFHWFSQRVLECIHASLQLIALRPLHRTVGFTPPTIRHDGLLRLAVEVIESSQKSSAYLQGRPWAWCENLFVPWHGLAVAIAELCVCNDPALMERYWPIVDQAFSRLGSLIADRRQGMLWRPMSKLMDRARTRRQKLQQSPPLPPPDVSFPSNLLTGHPLIPSFQDPTSLEHVVPEVPALPLDNTVPSGSVSMDSIPLGTVPNPAHPFHSTPYWLNVWDLMDLEDPTDAATGLCESAWTNYETFIEDVFDAGGDPALQVFPN
ncbi:hypothetical protein ASPZODRAFT_134109 [Penicilliopsis zonata CBS 506.65]|uniref:Zn(2)-C6 fungal-type domain-containing protein n=1 Tax=Penicilliopsis zonata CBS 506.65 TaxID=1073090 RepID=A0A1L9SE05_9EURO|nr:hypothetical protein ASPZODRAFT_134109 [Penicilliopsis zonata CBS 506.65]OJJ45455.1 hypothetical protein ASPZODRAFT_134109 [Penicilliopsis zonata CBS 506.65]